MNLNKPGEVNAKLEPLDRISWNCRFGIKALNVTGGSEVGSGAGAGAAQVTTGQLKDRLKLELLRYSVTAKVLQWAQT